MQLIELPVDSLIEYENNPRFNDEAVEPLANSIMEFGFKVPIVVDKDNVIIAGHTRLKAAKFLCLDTVPCIIADDLTEDQVKAFRLVDNKVAEIASWDYQALQSELDDIEIDMNNFGFADFSDVDIDSIFAEPDIETEDKEDEEVEEVEIQCPYCGLYFKM